MHIETPRLLLRPWEDRDYAPFAALNADPKVMRYFLSTLTRAESDAAIDTQIARAAARGVCFQPVERKEDGAFIGMVGIQYLDHLGLAFEPTVEIGWRLAEDHWGKGYATEAATAWLEYGFGELGLPEIVAFTATQNLPSQAVMKRLGMTTDPADDFAHPKVPEGNPLRRHVLYRLKRP